MHGSIYCSKKKKKKEVNKLFDHGLIVPSHRALPFIDELLESVHVANTLCAIDLFFGYHQIPVYPQDVERTTFT